MNVSQKGLSFITANEKLELSPYLDDAGVPTIGIGTTVYPGGAHVTMHDHPISPQSAQLFLLHDSSAVVLAANAMLKGITINQNQFDALVDFAYNEGTGALHGSTLLRLIKVNPADPHIKDAFHMWNEITVDGKRLFNKGLDSRRAREVALYFSPVV